MNIEELDWNQFSIDKTNRDCYDLILAAGKDLSLYLIIHILFTFRCRL
jgi:hypothetical protein